ncbi:MAG: hypothetical protein MJY59_02840 [Bacteroidaceae bacterium]|nr:hypothetical protein [Bacteroidaceae bacterium]
MRLQIVSTMLGMALWASCPVLGQEWVPTEEFPLLFRRMETATIHYGLFQDHEKVAPCNISVGDDKKTQTLVYINDSTTLMETDPANVNFVDFPDGRYVPVEQNYFGKIIIEDSVGKVIMVRDLDRYKLTEATRSTLSQSSRINMEYMRWYVPSESDSQLPMLTKFYFVYRGNTFEVTDKNILANINQKRRKEYLAYTRAAELISTSERSIRQLWADFFVNYDNVLKFYKKR